MIEQVVVAVATLALAAWFLAPLRGKRTTAVEADHEVEDLMELKQSVYRSLIDLELDHDLGKLAVEEYDRLKQEGKKEALELIRRIDGATPEGEPATESGEMTLEEEIRAARARLRRE